MAKDMEQTVDEETRDLFVETAVATRRLTGRRFHADHDIAQQPAPMKIALSLEQRKGELVGSPLLAAPLPVQLAELATWRSSVPGGARRALVFPLFSV